MSQNDNKSWHEDLQRHCHIKQVEGDSEAQSDGLRFR